MVLTQRGHSRERKRKRIRRICYRSQVQAAFTLYLLSLPWCNGYERQAVLADRLLWAPLYPVAIPSLSRPASSSRLGSPSPRSQALCGQSPSSAEAGGGAAAAQPLTASVADVTSVRGVLPGGGYHGGRLGSAWAPGCQGSSGSVLSLREERGVDEDLPPGGEQREGPLHQLELLSDCGREARRLRTLRGRAFRRWASPDFARHPPHRPRNAHCLRLPHPGQGCGGERGQAWRWCGSLTARKRPTDFSLGLTRTLIQEKLNLTIQITI